MRRSRMAISTNIVLKPMAARADSVGKAAPVGPVATAAMALLALAALVKGGRPGQEVAAGTAALGEPAAPVALGGTVGALRFRFLRAAREQSLRTPVVMEVKAEEAVQAEAAAPRGYQEILEWAQPRVVKLGQQAPQLKVARLVVRAPLGVLERLALLVSQGPHLALRSGRRPAAVVVFLLTHV